MWRTFVISTNVKIPVGSNERVRDSWFIKYWRTTILSVRAAKPFACGQIDWIGIYVCRSIAVFVVFIDQQFVVLCVCGRDILSIFCLSVFLWKSIKGLSWVYEHESLSIWVGAEVDLLDSIYLQSIRSFCTIRLQNTYTKCIDECIVEKMQCNWITLNESSAIGIQCVRQQS